MDTQNLSTNEIIVIPDVHGRPYWREVLKDTTDRPIVFLGDYLDPYMYEFTTDPTADYEKILKLAIQNFKAIIEFKKQNMNRVTLLIGNHDAHYLGIAEDKCRMDVRNLSEVSNLFISNKNLFNIAFKWNSTLFTHAGVTNGWLKQNKLEEKITISNIEDYLNNLLHSLEWSTPIVGWSGCRDYTYSPLTDIGRSRGGYAPHGGPTWADSDEMLFGAAFNEELVQIVGHSQQECTGTFLHNENFYCCDSRAIFIWNNKDLRKYFDN